MGDLKRVKEGNCLFLGKNLTHLEGLPEYRACKGIGFKTADFLLEVGSIHYLVEVKRLEFFKELFSMEYKENLNELRDILKKKLEKKKVAKGIAKRIDSCLSECSNKALKDLYEKFKDSLLFLTLNGEISRIKRLNYVIFLCPNARKKLGYDVVLPLKDNLNRILCDSIKGFENCLKIPFEVKVSFWGEPKPFDRVLFKVAVIDIGTYSTRITVAQIEEKSFKILYEEGHITALGRGVKRTKKLSKEAIGETLKVLRRFKKLCE